MFATSRPKPSPPTRVSTLELFFDLVFVFTITQVSELVLHAHNLVQLARPLLVLALVWWMYGGYAWLTNNIGTAQPLNRVLVLTAMAGFLVMALAVPAAFERDGLTFGLAYLMVNGLHAALFAHAPDQASARAIWRIAPFNIGTALLVVVAALLPPAWGWICWVGAVGVLATVPFFGKVGSFAIQPTHFVERHGLVLIIALGESIIAIGAGAAGEPLTPPLIAAAVLTLALNAALWWSYFSQDEQLAEHALGSVGGGERARMALYAFGYAHLVMVAGIVLLATGVKQVIGQPQAAEPLFTSGLVAGGIALYLVGDVLFRHAVRIPARRARLVAALASLLTIPLGQWAGGLAHLSALLAIFGALLVWEHAAAKLGSLAPAAAPGDGD
ncbi:MAG: low temperature requirement protein A [Chloroflexales bacterium]|nr:low temperature requirement protein A [Chloroflexales bacterium]